MDGLTKLAKSRFLWAGVVVGGLGLLAVAFPERLGTHTSQLVAWLMAALGGIAIAMGMESEPPEELNSAIRDASEGLELSRPASLDPAYNRVWEALRDASSRVRRVSEGEQRAREQEGELRRTIERLDEEGSRVKAELAEAERRAADPAELDTLHQKAETAQARVLEVEARLEDEVESHAAAMKRAGEALGELEQLQSQIARTRDHVRAAEHVVAEHVEKLGSGFGEQMSAVESTMGSMQEISTALHQISQHVEALASNAEESSSSILEMTATNDEVAENMANLANSVRETVSSIEEMTYSIKEVARNVDALSLTAEETSSSMNQMDVSIDQVQSNANETARLSEEVATDAERGAEAILKTINEINRIKETSSEAVQVIGNLGSRIEAIGDILNVIDDVAEQTNLLALNAAIIAAQAGEHGKGFAVVADEIKDLAERAGASTKEIAELIKTIQAESKKGIAAVELGAETVDRGVEVSAEAERALKKILSSSQKSTSMVRAIARATVEQAKGSKQVTDAIGRIAETVQQIAAATAEQARGSELIMKSAEKMRLITQHVERSSQEQARGGRQISQSIENISGMVNELHQSQRAQARGSEQTLAAVKRIHELTRNYEAHMRELSRAAERLRDASND